MKRIWITTLAAAFLTLSGCGAEGDGAAKKDGADKTAKAQDKKDATKDAAKDATKDAAKDAAKKDGADKAEKAGGEAESAGAGAADAGAAALVPGLAAAPPSEMVGSAIKLIPDGADMILGMSPKMVFASEIYGAYKAQIEAVPDYSEFMAPFQKCGLDPTTIDSIVIGGMMEDEKAIIVIDGPDAGKQDKVICLADERDKGAKHEIKRDAKLPYIEGKEATIIMVSNNRAVIAAAKWKDGAMALAAGGGEAAVDKSLKDVAAKANMSTALWSFGVVPPETLKEAAEVSPKLTEAKTYRIGVDLSSGIALAVSLAFADEGGAAEVANQLNGSLAKNKKEMGDLLNALPPDMKKTLDSLKASASGNEVSVNISVPTTVVQQIEQMASAFLGGGLGGPPGGGLGGGGLGGGGLGGPPPAK